jgi:hypothetical protein
MAEALKDGGRRLEGQEFKIRKQDCSSRGCHVGGSLAQTGCRDGKVGLSIGGFEGRRFGRI